VWKGRPGHVRRVARVARAWVPELGEGPVVHGNVVVDSRANGAVDLDGRPVGPEVGRGSDLAPHHVVGNFGLVAADHDGIGAVVVVGTGGIGCHDSVVVEEAVEHSIVPGASADLDAVQVVVGLHAADGVVLSLACDPGPAVVGTH
jgi:hypothetical protein